jgi:hypothetical protein
MVAGLVVGITVVTGTDVETVVIPEVGIIAGVVVIPCSDGFEGA